MELLAYIKTVPVFLAHPAVCSTSCRMLNAVGALYLEL